MADSIEKIASEPAGSSCEIPDIWPGLAALVRTLACCRVSRMTAHERNSQESPIAYCEEKQRLINEFVAASRELVEIQAQQTHGVIQGDPDFGRFDDLLHMARDRKDEAKYALIAHVEEHKC